MTVPTQRSTLQGILEGVADVGVVHDYERWSSVWSDFLNLFRWQTGNGNYMIRGWSIAYRGFAPTPVEEMHGGSVHVVREHTWLLRGMYSVQDSTESEKAASIWALSVTDALDNSTDLHLNPTFYDCTPAALTTFEPRLFGEVYCHFAEVTLRIAEFES